MPYTIRLATSADVPALAALAEATFVDTFGPDGFDVGYPEADLSHFLAESYAPERVAMWLEEPASQLLVAENEAGRLVAYAHSGANTLPYDKAGPGDGELKRIYLRRDAQGTGLGRALFERALDWLGDRPVLIGVWSENLKAQRFYAHYGFERVADYTFMVGQTADAEFILRRGA
jgi:ribosomal protein S18 acetylase RimI-like enzyme